MYYTCSLTKHGNGKVTVLSLNFQHIFLAVSESDTENEKAVPMEIFNVTQNGSLLLRIIQTGMTGEYKISIDQV